VARDRWTLPDLLDLEFFLAQEQHRDRDLSGARDLVGSVIGRSPREQDPATWLLLTWIRARRRQAGPTPGLLWQSTWNVVRWLFPLLAFVCGWSAVAGFLHYSGRTPVNVASFLLFFVFVHVPFLILVPVSLVAFQRAGGPVRSAGVPFPVRLLVRLSGWLPGVPGTTGRYRVAQLGGWLNRLLDHHAPVVLLPLVGLIQVTAAAFHGGVLIGFLARVAGSDLAFGWQSTLQVSAEAVFRLVRWLALPWSWLWPVGIGYPDLAQVRGSQMVLKEGIAHLATGDLVAWWPFLALCVAVYALLPRLVLFLVVRLLEQRFLQQVAPEKRAEARTLLRAIRLPHLRTTSRPRDEGTGDRDTLTPSPEDKTAALSSAKSAGGSAVDPKGSPAVLLLPGDLAESAHRERVAHLIRERFRVRITAELVWTGDPDGYPGLAARVGDAAEVYFLLEAWQPPIQETLDFFAGLRRHLDEATMLHVVLVGRPSAATILTPATGGDLDLWRSRMIQAVGPGLRVQALVEVS